MLRSLLLCIPLFSPAAQGSTQEPSKGPVQGADPIIATLDGKDIPLEDFATWIVSQRGENAIQSYLTAHALELEAERLGVRVPAGEIEAKIDADIATRVKGAFAGDEERWHAELRASGTNEAAYRALRRIEVRTELRAARILGMERTVHPEEVHTLFERRFGPDGRRMWLRTIRLPLVVPNQRSATMQQRQQRNREVRAALVARLEGIRRRILTGEDFATLAAELSEDEATSQRGGELIEPFSGDKWPALFVASIRALEGDAISEPIYGRGDFGIYQIVREEHTSLEEVAPELEREILDRPPAGGEMGLLLERLLGSLEVERLPGLLLSSTDPDEIVLRIAGRDVSRAELGSWIARQQGASYLEHFLQQRVVRLSAQEAGIVSDRAATLAQVDAELQQILEVSFRGKEEAFLADIEARGSTLEQLRAERAVRAEVELLVDELVRRERVITETALKNLWEDRYGPGGRGLQVRLIRRNVLLPEEARQETPARQQELAREATEAVRSELEAVAERCRNGEDFGAIAQRISEDPGTVEARGRVAGRFPIRRWPDAVQAALAELQTGDFSQPVPVQGAFYLFQVLEVKQVELAEVEEELRAKLAAEPASVPERSSFMNQLLERHEWTVHPERLLDVSSGQR